MSEFNALWDHIVTRCDSSNFPLVQNKEELEYVFNLIKGSTSYLEVGTAEGNSLYVLAHAMPKGSEITYIDIDEPRIRPKREKILQGLADYKITGLHGNSHDPEIVRSAWQKRYDCVLIDAGHTYDDAIQDARNYAPLADKYIIFHDVQMPSVMDAFRFYQKETGLTAYTVINSENFGFGIMTV